jgi:hypothetical protein
LSTQIRHGCEDVTVRIENKIKRYKAILSKRKKYDLAFKNRIKAES